ncbi:MAG: MerR family transcriptional regulator [Muribaculum sp.]|nr:MerR family transcriptional regulator [Muribaculum sp.]
MNLKEDRTEKLYFKIQEVAEETGINPSTLRYWETEFPELSPGRTSTGQRKYTAADIDTVRIIRFLLKDRGLKIEAARQQLGANHKNISRRLQIINALKIVREDLTSLLDALDKRASKL